MIEVHRLSKRYGPVTAVDDVSFSVGRGEIVGLLGPNGAGKTTTMRILTTFLAQTSGRAALAGHDVLDEPLEVRRRVGYLPENVPLYSEMRVREYVSFRAKLKDVPRAKRRAAVDGAIARCRLDDVAHRVIGHLSKGYRQRVGLAEAMVHDPDVLILDEPTSGLDPVQVREVRSLIRELGDNHTILLSTHVMQEVEAVCRRVIIVARGRIVVDDTLEGMQAERLIVVEVRGPADKVRAALETVPGAGTVRRKGHDDECSVFEVTPLRAGSDPREALAQRVFQNGWALRRLDWQRTKLEDRFIEAVAREAGAVAMNANANAEREAG